MTKQLEFVLFGTTNLMSKFFTDYSDSRLPIINREGNLVGRLDMITIRITKHESFRGSALYFQIKTDVNWLLSEYIFPDLALFGEF